MSEKTLEEKVKDIIVEEIGVDPDKVVPSATLIDDLGMDSIDTIELIMAFEEEFHIEISDEDVEKIQTVSEVVKYLRKVL